MSDVAIVGSGLAALTAFATLREGGVDADVYGERGDPAEVWRERAAAIRQTHMRSESDGHVRPRTFPGLAAREAWRRRDPRPLAQSVLDRYRPSVTEFLEDVERVRETTGWAVREQRVDEIRPVDGGFLVAGAEYRHVLVATGHPGLAVPDELAADPRAVHAYEPHEYADKVAVVGAGMAAATEWRNALAAGAEVVSIRRRDPLRRPLNLPRQLFTKRGLARYHASPPAERASFLGKPFDPQLPARAGLGRAGGAPALPRLVPRPVPGTKWCSKRGNACRRGTWPCFRTWSRTWYGICGTSHMRDRLPPRVPPRPPAAAPRRRA